MLGTTTKVETVNRALQLVARSGDRQAGQARFDELLDLDRADPFPVGSSATS